MFMYDKIHLVHDFKIPSIYLNFEACRLRLVLEIMFCLLGNRCSKGKPVIKHITAVFNYLHVASIGTRHDHIVMLLITAILTVGMC